MRKAFTLIELMVALSIFSIMSIYLYTSYQSLQVSNVHIKNEAQTMHRMAQIQKVLFLDFSLASHRSVTIQNRDTKEDFVYFQTSNSLHLQERPYVAYMLKNEKLYRVESLEVFTSFQLHQDMDIEVEYIGEVQGFNVYPSKLEEKESYLISIDFKKYEDVLLKVKVLNSY